MEIGTPVLRRRRAACLVQETYMQQPTICSRLAER
jgi:hypothetical protein